MTNLAEATDLIFKDWIAYMATKPTPTPPYVFENEESEADARPLFEGSKPWYRVTTRELAGGRANLNGVVGTRKYERTGLLMIQFFDLQGKGVKSIQTEGEAMRDYFEDRRLSNDVLYLNADLRQQPPDGKWKPILLEITFEFTDRK